MVKEIQLENNSTGERGWGWGWGLGLGSPAAAGYSINDLLAYDEHLSQSFCFFKIENREDILNASDKLTEVLEEANTLFNGGNSLFYERKLSVIIYFRVILISFA